MLFKDVFILELLILLSVFFYITHTNLTMLLYTGGIYLILIGIFALINDSDLFIGFLWVIDLGVGLVFFIFILHFTSFLFQKSSFNISSKFFFISLVFIQFILIFYYYLPQPVDSVAGNDLSRSWFFKTSYLDYYKLFNTNEVTDLNTLRDLYFLSNSFEFFLINFSLFFGLVASILLCFIIQRVFNFINYSQIQDLNTLDNLNTGFYIRNQNYINQQSTPSVNRLWAKTRNK